ncbi:MAG: MFS transporter [Gammaproteobacteria bacterium]|nr:MFS transporter [Gammaproteobacteria bacterium]
MQNTHQSSEDFLGHPRGLYVLFLTEMWERFSYYGMRALLILYLTKHFMFGDKEAGLLYGSYAALVYAMPVIGGLIADRYLGFSRSTLLGAWLLVAGHFGMAFEGPPANYVGDELVRNSLYEQIFYLSLAFIVVGVGLLKPSISNLVGQLYLQSDPRRDSGFTIFYMGINLGAFSATLLCAYLGETYGWRYGFGLAGVGMLVGLFTFSRGSKHLAGVGGLPAKFEQSKEEIPLASRQFWPVYLGLAFSVLVVWQLVQYSKDLGILLIVLGFGILVWFCWFSLKRCTKIERDRMIALLVLISFSVFFWALFEQAGSSITLFTDRNVEMGETFTAGMFQSFNPLFIIFLAPLFAWSWTKLARMNMEPSAPLKFGLAIFQVGFGFAILVYGSSFAGPDGKVAVIWLALMYLFHTTGELCLSPVGLAMVTRLSVSQVSGMMMGVWFLSSSFAAYIGGVIAGAMAIERNNSSVLIGRESLSVYMDVFTQLGVFAMLLGFGLMLISPFIKRLMHQ